MARKVIWSPRAITLLEEAAETMDSPNAAMRLVEEALDLADTLAEMSERGRLVPELTDGIHRELFIKRYRMVYRVGADHVAIVAFVHGARDFRSWWKQHRKPN